MAEDNEYILKLAKTPENIHVGRSNSFSEKQKDPYEYLKHYKWLLILP